MKPREILCALALLPWIWGCDASSAPAPSWALAIHGGAGSTLADADRAAYEEALSRGLRLGSTMLDEGRSGIDVVEAVVRLMEDDPLFNAGRGAVFNRAGGHELDASIMDGETLACGGVAGVSTVRHPVTLARHVMQETAHVLLVGAGAERFADGLEVERVEPSFFDTPRRREAWEASRGTVGAVALDRGGHLAAATSTGGLTAKLPGRVGDSPIVGAGTYADDRSCAVSGTGKGEEYIRHSVARSIAWLVEREGLSVQRAAEQLIHETLQPGDGGVIVLAGDGEIAMVFNTPGMLRGAADADGRFEVRTR